MVNPPFNPLDKLGLAKTVVEELLKRPCGPVRQEEAFEGAGIYAIYYTGPFEAYAPISQRNQHGRCELPIYVGKAVPPGARKGGFGLGEAPGQVLFRRLLEHARTIEEAENLELADFVCRYLVVDDIWIPLAEQLLIEWFSPIWNTAIDGFGNHDPGKGRRKQQRSQWDTIHPGRVWAKKQRPNAKPARTIIRELKEALEKAKKQAPNPQMS